MVIPSRAIPASGLLSHVIPNVGEAAQESSGSVSVLLAPYATSPSVLEQQLSSPVIVPSLE